MLVTGSINTISVKWADKMKSLNTAGDTVHFKHPFLQACGMFLGEMSCMVAFYILKWIRKRKQQRLSEERRRLGDDGGPEDASSESDEQASYNPLVFLPPALCDMTATSVQYIGLSLTYASSFQMLRGAVIIFTGILSVLFLRRQLQWFRWVGILFVIGGLVTVGTTDILFPPPPKNGTDVNATSAISDPRYYRSFGGDRLIMGERAVSAAVDDDDAHSTTEIMIGDILIISAQVIVATQMVYEEKFISKYNVPALQAVGWEGTFGFLTLSTLLIPMYFIPVGDAFSGNPRGVLEDAYDGLFQLAHNPQLAGAFSLTVVSIAFFNFAGISVTKEMSATTRMVLDSVRTLVIWGVSLGVGWQVFQWLQLVGFVILVIGMCIYNDLLIVPGIKLACYKLGILDRPGSYYDMQQDYSDDDEDEDNNGTAAINNGNDAATATTVFDPRHGTHQTSTENHA